MLSRNKLKILEKIETLSKITERMYKFTIEEIDLALSGDNIANKHYVMNNIHQHYT